MKKVLAICLMMIMVVSMSMNVFAAPNGFVSSPSETPGPGVVDFQPSDEDCTAEINITPYGEHHNLSDALRTMFENAYKQITEAEDLTTLNTLLAKVAADNNIDPEKLAVSDLFDIHVTGCDYHTGHTDFDVILDVDALKSFVGLLHMRKNGEWEFVKDAKVVNNGTHLKFSVEDFSPFAIVVDTTKSTGSAISPQTGENGTIYIYAALMAVSAVALAFVLVKSKKQRD